MPKSDWQESNGALRVNSFICTHAAVFFLMGEARPRGSGVCSPPKLKCGKNGVDVAARKQDLRFFIHSVMSW